MGKPVFLSVSKEFNVPKDKLWNTIAVDFGGVSKYNSGIAKSNFIGEKRECVGTERHCDFPKKGWIEETITEWNDKSDFKLQVKDTTYPMSHMESKFSFEDTPNGSKLTQEFWYRMKPGFMSGIMKGKMRKMLEEGLEGLNKYVTKEG